MACPRTRSCSARVTRPETVLAARSPGLHPVRSGCAPSREMVQLVLNARAVARAFVVVPILSSRPISSAFTKRTALRYPSRNQHQPLDHFVRCHMPPGIVRRVGMKVEPFSRGVLK